MELELLEWDDKYSVGYKLIDEQHKRLFVIYNQVVKIKQQEKQGAVADSAVLGQILKDLSDYVHIHFLTEEEVMKVYGYEQFEPHKKIHDQFFKIVEEICNDFNKGQLVLIDTFVRTIHKWLVHHVMVEDQKYKGLLR